MKKNHVISILLKRKTNLSNLGKIFNCAIVLAIYVGLSNPIQAQSQQITLAPINDAYLETQNGITTRYNEELLRVEAGSRVRNAYLMFDLSTINGTITDVKLELTIYTDAGDGIVNFYKGIGDNWTENNLSNANKPSISGSPIGSVSGTHADNSLKIVDINPSVITGNMLSLVIQHTTASDIAFASNGPETSNPIAMATVSMQPKLKITFSTGTTTDTQSPSVVTLTSTSKTQTTVDLSWSGATDNVGVTGYMVYKDGTLENTLGNVLGYNVTGLNPNTSYNFTVKALDAAGNESLLSNTVSVTTSSSADTQPPTAPTLSSAGRTDTTLNLSWSGATDNTAVTGYRIFKDGTLETTLANIDTYQVTGLTAGTAYSFTVTALDGAGNESAYSDTLTVTTDASSGGSGGNVTWTKSGSNVSMESNSDNLAIGRSTVPNGYKLAVEGNIRTREVRVDQDSWPDYVFEEDYDLPSLSEIQKHIREKGHLPHIPSAKEVEQNGIELGEMNKLLLEKIEELILYTIQQQKEIELLNKKLENQ